MTLIVLTLTLLTLMGPQGDKVSNINAPTDRIIILSRVHTTWIFIL